MQFVAGDDRRIYHAKAHTIAAIDARNKDKRSGCGVLDNDYKAAFDMMVSSWPIKVLVKKGVGPVMEAWLKSLFDNVYSTVVANGVLEATIKLERSLRQGDLPSMTLFAFGIYPHLSRLLERLQGIPLYTRPGPTGSTSSCSYN